MSIIIKILSCLNNYRFTSILLKNSMSKYIYTFMVLEITIWEIFL